MSPSQWPPGRRRNLQTMVTRAGDRPAARSTLLEPELERGFYPIAPLGGRPCTTAPSSSPSHAHHLKRATVPNPKRHGLEVLSSFKPSLVMKMRQFSAVSFVRYLRRSGRDLSSSRACTPQPRPSAIRRERRAPATPPWRDTCAAPWQHRQRSRRAWASPPCAQNLAQGRDV